MKIKKNKIGELTTQQLVTLIILIVSFVVILFLIFGLDLGETTNKEICHNSVVMKGQSVLSSGSLDCKTTYVCISGGGKCEDFNEDYTIEINMNQGPEKVKNDTMKAIADEMADCWWMFGEGKLDYVGITWGKDCGICSIIKFDKTISENEKSNLKEITYLDFYNYLLKPKDKTETYLRYIYDIDALPSNNKVGEIKINEEIIKTSEKYAIVLGSEWVWGADNHLYPSLVKSAEAKTKTGCKNLNLIKA